jgi:mono/diheme cytochrome c family protein
MCLADLGGVSRFHEVTMKTYLIASALVALSLAAGCSKGGGGPRPTAEARQTFQSRCAPCHGETGKGDGASASALNPKPRNFSDAAWQQGIKDDDIRKVIVKGGAAVGKSSMMPAAPDLESNTALVDGLVGVIRNMK